MLIVTTGLTPFTSGLPPSEAGNPCILRLCFWAWPWTTWAPLMPSELNLAALTRSILTIKRNPTRPPQIIKPSSKKPAKWLSTFTFLFSILGPPCRFSQPHGSKTQNRLRKIQKCEAAIPTIWNKNNTILSTLQLCTLQIFTNAQTQKID